MIHFVFLWVYDVGNTHMTFYAFQPPPILLSVTLKAAPASPTDEVTASVVAL